MDVDYALQHVPRMPLYSSFERKITQQIEGEKMISNELDEKAKQDAAGDHLRFDLDLKASGQKTYAL